MQSYVLGSLRIDKVRAQAALMALLIIAALFAFCAIHEWPFDPLAADNLIGAQVIGISVRRVYAITAGIGMACAGAAGALISPMFDTQPFLATDFTLIAFIIVIVGGLGSLSGALLGGVSDRAG